MEAGLLLWMYADKFSKTLQNSTIFDKFNLKRQFTFLFLYINVALIKDEIHY